MSTQTVAANLVSWLNELESAKGKSKQGYLRKFSEERTVEEIDVLKEFFVQCYEPTITYGVTDAAVIPAGFQDATHASLAVMKLMLDNLASRHLTGNSAEQAIHQFCRRGTAEQVNILSRILKRDARVGCGISTVNNVFSGLISTFEVMLAAKFEASKIVFPAHVEPKYDGMRVVAVEMSHEVFEFYTRSGKVVDTISDRVRGDVAALASAMRGETGTTDHMMFDGELMGETFAATMKGARKKGEIFEEGCFHIFDWVPKKEFFGLSRTKESRLEYTDRRRCLSSAFAIAANVRSEYTKLPITYICGSLAELDQIYRKVRESGLEGLIIKTRAGKYRPSRHRDWMKMKAEETEDLPIVGIERGTGKYAHCMGALVVNRQGVEVSVGGGFSDEQREAFWKIWHMDERELKGTLAEVQFQEVTPDGSLRHPRFIRLRTDKTTPESAWS